MRMIRKFAWLLILLPLLAGGGFVFWAETPLGPMPEALAALQSDAQVQVETSPWLAFRPAGQAPDTGLIFYPGGRVDPRSYAPAARSIAAQGYLAVIVPMPLNLAVISPGRAAQVISAYPQIRHWAIGGHSLGGAMAASFAHQHPDQVQGVFFWGAYPAAGDSLANLALQVTSIFGTQDGLATGGKIEASRPLLPQSTRWVSIQGGNHGQFGWYGDQPGDNPAQVTRQAQQQQAIQATLELLAQIKASAGSARVAAAAP